MSKARTTGQSKPSGDDTQVSPQTSASTTSPRAKLRRESYYPDLYPPETPLALIQFFEGELDIVNHPIANTLLKARYRIHYGDTLTGRAWGDHDEGYISLSSGDRPVPIVLYNRNSTGGPAILMKNIVKIEATIGGKPLYRHPRFHTHNEEPPPVEERPKNERVPRRISMARNEQQGET